MIAGSPTLPLTRSLALDLERKGFVVYIVSNSVEDEVMVQALSRPDIRPLTIDITDVSFLSLSTLPTFSLSADWSDAETKSPLAQAPLSRGLPTICSHRTRAVPGVKRTYLSLTAVILIPVTPLPDVAHRDHPAIELRRPVQYPPTPPDPDRAGLPTPPHRRGWARQARGRPPRCWSHPFHRFVHQPALATRPRLLCALPYRPSPRC